MEPVNTLQQLLNPYGDAPMQKALIGFEDQVDLVGHHQDDNIESDPSMDGEFSLQVNILKVLLNDDKLSMDTTAIEIFLEDLEEFLSLSSFDYVSNGPRVVDESRMD